MNGQRSDRRGFTPAEVVRRWTSAAAGTAPSSAGSQPQGAGAQSSAPLLHEAMLPKDELRQRLLMRAAGAANKCGRRCKASW